MALLDYCHQAMALPGAPAQVACRLCYTAALHRGESLCIGKCKAWPGLAQLSDMASVKRPRTTPSRQ